MARTALATKHPHRPNDEQLVVRLPTSLIERVDALAEEMRAEMSGVKLSRADIVRMLLTQALDAKKTKR